MSDPLWLSGSAAGAYDERNTWQPSDELVRQIHAAGTIRWCEQPVRLAHLGESHIYVNGREEINFHPVYGESLLQPIYHQIYQRQDERRPVVIGVPHAGSCLAAIAGGLHGLPRAAIGCLLVRAEEKHTGGEKPLLPPPDQAQFWYSTIDNVISSGNSLLQFCILLERYGYEPQQQCHFTLFDRGFGGIERLRYRGYNVYAPYHVPSIIERFVALGLWQPEQLDTVRAEVARLSIA